MILLSHFSFKYCYNKWHWKFYWWLYLQNMFNQRFYLNLFSAGFSRDVTSNIPMLNIPDNWMTPTNPGMLQSNTPAPQSQYSMWMGNHMGNIPTNQNCAMPYLRSPNPYPFTSSNTSISSVPNVTVSNPAASSSFDTSKFESCDISSFAPNRDVLRTSAWSPLTPPPIWSCILPPDVTVILPLYDKVCYCTIKTPFFFIIATPLSWMSYRTNTFTRACKV